MLDFPSTSSVSSSSSSTGDSVEGLWEEIRFKSQNTLYLIFLPVPCDC